VELQPLYAWRGTHSLSLRVLLRLWNDAEWQCAEREREERELLKLARRLLEWDGRAEELPTVR